MSRFHVLALSVVVALISAFVFFSMGSSSSTVAPAGNAAGFLEPELAHLELGGETVLEEQEGCSKLESIFKHAIRGSSKREAENFACTIWRPKDKPKALLFLCHGYAESIRSETWDHVGRFFAQHGFLTFGHDHLGHGLTTGERVQSSVSFLEDYSFPVAAHAHSRSLVEGKDLPVFLLGHSMGGLIALLAAHFAPKGLFRGVILVGPMIEVDPKIASPFNIFVAKTLSKVWPSLQMSGIDNSEVTTDKEWVKKIDKDENYWHGGIKIKQGLFCLNALQDFEANRLKELDFPMLIQQGQNDTICLPSGTERLKKEAKSEDKTYKTYEDAKHNLFLETGDTPKRAMGDQLAWMEERIK